MKKILIIDDSLFSRMKLKNILKTKYSVIEAENGKDGLEVLEKEKPDFIFLDLLMPVMNGLKFLEIKETLKNNTPVVVLTSDVQQTTKKICMEKGAKNLINKPFNSQIIKEELDKYIE